MGFSPADGSSVEFSFFAASALFPTLPRLVASLIVFIATPGLCRLGVGSVPNAGDSPMAYLGLRMPRGWDRPIIYLVHLIPIG